MDLHVEGQAPHPKLVSPSQPALVDLVVQEMAARGHLIHPGGLNLSLAHSQYEVAAFLAALEDSLDAIADGIPLKGLPSEPAFSRDPARAA